MSIVTSPAGAEAKYCDKYVCVSVFPRAYLRSHKRDLHQFFVHIAYGRGSGPPPAGCRNLTGRGSFGCFPPIDSTL